MRLDDEQVRQQVGRLEELLTELQSKGDSPGGAAGLVAVQALVDVYGEALARIVGRVGERAPEVVAELADDELVSHLLLVHELHPLDGPARVRGALDAVRSALGSRTVSLELLGIDDGCARVSVSGAGCSTETVRTEVEEAVRAAAPEIAGVEVEAAGASAPTFIALDAVTVR